RGSRMGAGLDRRGGGSTAQGRLGHGRPGAESGEEPTKGPGDRNGSGDADHPRRSARASRAPGPPSLPPGLPRPGRPFLLRTRQPQSQEEAMNYMTADLLARIRSQDPDLAERALAEWESA